MSTTWILVANARRARLFAHHGPNKGLELVRETMAQAEPVQARMRMGRSERRMGRQQDGSRGFAHQLARELHEGRSRGRYARTILVAPPGFMGLLNSELDPPTASLVSNRVDKDYTRAQQQVLCGHLQQCLCV